MTVQQHMCMHLTCHSIPCSMQAPFLAHPDTRHDHGVLPLHASDDQLVHGRSIPSLAAFVINRFNMGSDTIGYNIAGQGCAAGLLAVGLAQECMQVSTVLGFIAGATLASSCFRVCLRPSVPQPTRSKAFMLA